MRERMSYYPHPDHPDQTVMKQETEVAVRGVPLTDYIENSIISMCSLNSGKGRVAMDWVVDKLGGESRNVSASLVTILYFFRPKNFRTNYYLGMYIQRNICG
jgi:hypothetical protein